MKQVVQCPAGGQGNITWRLCAFPAILTGHIPHLAGVALIKFALKIVTTLLLLWLAWQSINVAELAAISIEQPVWLGWAILVTCCMIGAQAVMFGAAVAAEGYQIRLGTSALYSLVGWFFSNLAPSSFGADIFRGVQMTRIGMPPATAFGIALAVRLVSFGTLVAVIACALPVGLRQTEVEGRCLLAVVAVFAVAGFGVAFICSLAADRIRSFPWPTIIGKYVPALGVFADFFRPTGSTARCWIFALLNQLLLLALIWTLSQSLSLSISLIQVLALVPSALLLATVPITIGSWGVRELSFVQILGSAGIAPEAALSVSVAFGLFRMFVGAVGGLVWVISTKAAYSIGPSN